MCSTCGVGAKRKIQRGLIFDPPFTPPTTTYVFNRPSTHTNEWTATVKDGEVSFTGPDLDNEEYARQLQIQIRSHHAAPEDLAGSLKLPPTTIRFEAPFEEFRNFRLP
jgi:hypothetical protein